MQFFRFFLIISFSFYFSGNLLLAQKHYFAIKNKKQLKQFFRLTEDRLPLISAHRGGDRDSFPENCIETFERTLAFTHAIIECDVVMSKDSQLVMLHDQSLDRTTTGKGNVSDYTLFELQKFYLKDKNNYITSYRIPTLETVLKWAKGKTILTLDIKKGVPPAKVVETVKKLKAEHYALIITYSLEFAKEYYRLAPDLMLSLNIRDTADIRQYEKAGIPFRQTVAFIGVGKINKAALDNLHQRGVYCILGTMGNLDKQAEEEGSKVYADLFRQGIDIITGDKPLLVAEALKEFYSKKSSKKRFFK